MKILWMLWHFENCNEFNSKIQYDVPRIFRCPLINWTQRGAPYTLSIPSKQTPLCFLLPTLKIEFTVPYTGRHSFTSQTTVYSPQSPLCVRTSNLNTGPGGLQEINAWTLLSFCFYVRMLFHDTFRYWVGFAGRKWSLPDHGVIKSMTGGSVENHKKKTRIAAVPRFEPNTQIYKSKALSLLMRDLHLTHDRYDNI
jgi:hypothetical protein